MNVRLDRRQGTRLDLDTYYPEFAANFHHTEFWKLERGQHFAEPSNPSWIAFNRGRWKTAMKLLDPWQQALRAIHDHNLTAEAPAYRIRIVEEPLTPYMRWELELLHRRNEVTGRINVIAADDELIAEIEQENGAQLPDLNIMDTLMYEVVYDANGVIDHVYKYTDPDTITPWRDLTKHLYREGFDMEYFYRAHVMHLPPPQRPDQLPADYLQKLGRPTQPPS
jgi:hypothetical protein